MESIEVDLRDGFTLLRLLEVISGEKIPPREKKGKLRVHKVSNINQALEYVGSKGVRLVGVGAEGMYGLRVHYMYM